MSISYFIVEDAIKNSETIFATSVSAESEFDVYLINDTKYKMWVVDLNGPEKIDISIGKGSYIAFEDTFILMHPEGDYLPYRPDFTVKENGTYQIYAKPLDSGTIRIGIRKSMDYRYDSRCSPFKENCI